MNMNNSNGISDRAELRALADHYDHSNMSEVIKRFPTQIEIALSQNMASIPKGPFKRVYINGMGGSALPVDVVADAFAEKLNSEKT